MFAILYLARTPISHVSFIDQTNESCRIVFFRTRVSPSLFRTTRTMKLNCISLSFLLAQTAIACTVDTDCNGERTYCNKGKCAKLKEIKDPCLGAKCAPFLYCDTISKSCHLRKMRDQFCLRDEECQDAMMRWNKKCNSRSQLEEPCISDKQCAAELKCKNGKCKTTNTHTFLSQLGEKCSDYRLCNTGLYCDGKKCQKKRSDGETCANGSECDDWLFCRVGRCSIYLQKGMDCTNLNQCAPGLTCKDSSGTCEVPKQ